MPKFGNVCKHWATFAFFVNFCDMLKSVGSGGCCEGGVGGDGGGGDLVEQELSVKPSVLHGYSRRKVSRKVPTLPTSLLKVDR